MGPIPANLDLAFFHYQMHILLRYEKHFSKQHDNIGLTKDVEFMKERMLWCLAQVMRPGQKQE